MFPKTVTDLKSQLYTHPDVGVTLTINTAIMHLIDKGKISMSDAITPDSLEAIRQAIYDTNDPSRGAKVDPMIMLFEALLSSNSSSPAAGNPTEGALQYIESLTRQYRMQPPS